jgi:hypothetical protein
VAIPAAALGEWDVGSNSQREFVNYGRDMASAI